MSALALPLKPQPMPERKRFGIATVTSLSFHALVILVVGLLPVRVPERLEEMLMPVELTVTEQPPAQATLELGGAGRPDAPKRVEPMAAWKEKPVARPSSPGGKAERAPAPPRILTSKGGKEPAGPVGRGREASGTGGKVDVPAGPSYGVSVFGAALPIYPKNALDQRLEGRVTLLVSVDPDGKVQGVTVESSSGQKLLDDAAVRAVQQGWTFKGGMTNGKPAAGEVRITFEFSDGTVKAG